MPNKYRLAQHVVYASRAAKIAKASRFGIAASAILTFVIFAISYYGQMVGNVTLKLDRNAQGASITMYEDAELQQETILLRAGKVEDNQGMTALCGTEYSMFELGHDFCIPSDEILGAKDGNNNGKSYLVYTFYVRNSGSRIVDLNAVVNVLAASKSAEESIRFRVIFDGVGTTYARRQTDKGTSPGELEPLTQEFLTAAQVLNQDFERFTPEQVLRVTIVIWYEGEDADHDNSIRGGGVKFEMRFSITNTYDEEE